MKEEELVRFVLREARLIDEKRFDEWYELFTDDAYYWVPLVPGQTDPLAHNSLAYEDKLLLKLRIERLKQPTAYSQKPASRCLHVMQMPEVEKADPARGEYLTRTPLSTPRRAATNHSATRRAPGTASSPRPAGCASG